MTEARSHQVESEKEKHDAVDAEQISLNAQQAKIQKAIPELSGQVTVKSGKEGGFIYTPITGILEGREYTSIQELKAAFDLSKKGIAFPKKEI